MARFGSFCGTFLKEWLSDNRPALHRSGSLHLAHKCVWVKNVLRVLLKRNGDITHDIGESKQLYSSHVTCNFLCLLLGKGSTAINSRDK